MLAQVRLGGDPAAEKTASRQAETVCDILDAYLAQARSLRKPSTATLYKLYIDKHLAPALGAKRPLVCAETRLCASTALLERTIRRLLTA